MKASTRTSRGLSMAVVLSVLSLAAGPHARGNEGVATRRPIHTWPNGEVGSELAVHSEPGGAGSALTPEAVRTRTVDSTLWTGYENAIYAADDDTVYVAYKRFTQDPSTPGYIPAELRLGTSGDGGLTWELQVVDPDAIESGDTIENSVSIGGDGGSTLYIAYHVRSSGAFADMKLKVARSTDGGATWAITAVADGFAGDYTSIRVLGADTAIVSAHANGVEEGVHVYITRNGGGSWSESMVEGGLGNGYYTSVGATRLGDMHVAWYNSLYPDHTDLNAARRRQGAWRTTTVDGSPGDLDLTGLGASTWVAPGPTVWIVYEAGTSLGTFVRSAKFVAGTPGWTIVPIQQGGTLGWNTAVHSVGTTNVYASYWEADATTGDAIFAVSSDGGASWTPLPLPEQRYVTPYIDSWAPSTLVQYESYQAQDAAGLPVLRVARIEGIATGS